MFRIALPHESSHLVSLATATGLFTPDEAQALLGGVLDDFHAGRLGEGHQVYVWANEPTGTASGWVYFAPSFKAVGVWDLWWIGVDPAAQKTGIGGRLLESVEARIQADGGRLLIIETSSTESFDPVRRFYTKRGYANCGTIPDFYADGDGKTIFAKRLEPRDVAR